jgi:hypothetical protein
MGIASFSGASSVIKPGVVTSSTRPSSPFVGQLIYETDTARVAAYNGSAWVTQNGLQLVKTQTIGSAVSSVTVSDVFSSTYDNYKIIIANTTCSTAAGILLTLNGSAGSTYNYGGFYTTLGTTTLNGESSAGTSAGIAVGLYANNKSASVIEIQNPFNSVATTLSAMSAGGTYTYVINGIDTNAASSTAFTLDPQSSATLTGGTIRVYGYANN